MTVINITSFGAIGDGVTDCSSAIANADGAASGIVKDTWPNDQWPHPCSTYLYFPPGLYRCHDVVHDPLVPWVGSPGHENTMLQYNGSNSDAGSCLVKFAEADYTGSISGGYFPQFRDLAFNGFSGGEDGQIAESLIRNNGSQGLDWSTQFDNCYFVNCWGDAIDLGKYIINCYLQRMRFDNIGGWLFTLDHIFSDGEAIFSLRDFTWDNSVNDNTGQFATRAQALGKYDGSRWGKGLFKLTGNTPPSIVFENGRIEINTPLRMNGSENRTCMILQDMAESITIAKYSLKRLKANFGDASTVWVRNRKGRTHIIHEDVSSLPTNAKLYDGDSSANGGNEMDQFAWAGAGSFGNHFDGFSGVKGITVGGSRIEFRDDTPSNDGAYTVWKKGDRVFNRNGIGAWVVTTVHGCAYSNSDMFSGSVMANASTLLTSVPALVMKRIMTGLNIRLAQAASPFATLDARVVNFDEINNTITLTAATTWSGATSITPIAATFTAV